MPTTSEYILESLKKQIAGFENGADVQEIGTVIEVGDGITRMTGLTACQASEMLEFPAAPNVNVSTFGVVLNLEEETVGAMILGEYKHLKEGDTVKRTKRILSVPVGEAFVGRVVNPLGQPLDGKGAVKETKFYPIEKVAPGVLARQPVHQPVQTGIKAIDAMIPIGRGQRELIIGDRQTGKTAVAVDAIINQKDIICVYVAIGQKESKVARIVAKLEEAGAMKHTIVVVAGASDPAALSFIAPYAGSAMGEYFMDRSIPRRHFLSALASAGTGRQDE
ncbi:MAG: ATP synthase subunit alpha [Candidatus Magasanikbacteria bacterium]|nr:ATP synthase subunit alpha [Candidatus Magasanikbacteria bacterium]